MLSERIRKKTKALHLKKYRTENSLFIAEGKKCNEDLIKNGAEPEYFLYSEAKENFLPEKISYQAVAPELEKLSLQSTPAGIIGVFKQRIYEKNNKVFHSGPRLFLDGLQDPGNLGTIIRTAHWFGISSIILSKDSVEWYNPKTVQSTMGSLLSVPFIYIERSELPNFKGEGKILCADMGGASIYETQFGGNDIVCIGNESKGISDELKKLCDTRVHIPAAHENNKPESLNAAVTATLFLYKMMGKM